MFRVWCFRLKVLGLGFQAYTLIQARNFVYCACHMICPLQPIMFHKRQNSLSRYFVSEGKIALGDILPQETK